LEGELEKHTLDGEVVNCDVGKKELLLLLLLLLLKEEEEREDEEGSEEEEIEGDFFNVKLEHLLLGYSS
jgi:hypothetical protein